MRPVLAPAARRVWRGTTTLQLWLSPERSVLVEGLDAQSRLVLPLLDGVRTDEQVVREAVALGCASARDVLSALEDGGVLVDADGLQVPSAEREQRQRLGPDLAALTLEHGSGAAEVLRVRAEAHVVVHGAGRVGAPLAALLSDAGVGTVEVLDRAETRWEDLATGGLQAHDVGRPRAEALASRVRPSGATRRPDLLVLTDEVPEQLARVLVRDGVPHLVARVDGLQGTVGPFVLPGRTACLLCQDLVRAAVDPHWPHLLPTDEAGLRLRDSSHGVLASAVASQSAMQALELLAGGSPASAGGTLELTLPGWRWRRRSWPAHPGCDCGASGPSLADTA